MSTLAEGGKIWNPGSKGIVSPRYAKLVEGALLWTGIASTFFYFLLAVILRIFGDFVIHTTDQNALTITTDTSASNIMLWLNIIAPGVLVFGLYLLVERKNPQRLPIRTISIMNAPQKFRERTVFAFVYGVLLMFVFTWLGGAILANENKEGEKIGSIQEWATTQTGLEITKKQAASVYQASKEFPVTDNYTNDLSRVETKNITVGKDIVIFSISHSSKDTIVFRIEENKQKQ